MIAAVSHATAPVPRRVSDMLISRKTESTFLPTSLAQLDAALRGGFAFSTITELVGPSGCGKTQFCMMLAVQASLPLEHGGLGGGVVYIDTESAFSATRLVEMAVARYPHVYDNAEAVDKLANRILICSEATCESLMARLDTLDQAIVERGAKLVILDSVASLVRKEYDSKSMVQRTAYLSNVASVLKYLAESFSIPIVVTNQVTTSVSMRASFDGNNYGGASSAQRETDGVENVEAQVTAALGNTWSHCVNTRLVVEYVTDELRTVKIAKSPIAPCASFSYVIEPEGLVIVSDVALFMQRYHLENELDDDFNEPSSDAMPAEPAVVDHSASAAIGVRTALRGAQSARNEQHTLVLEEQRNG
ncbi:hypothetical protein CAOG_01223 [Capsaspora owczarzaki ATCC 30864]|uniref:hypothetical protein n=1 Tax=Capsaspora owczarzaki (strain ATCC 30864) TaxID=595528 RepID=UPI0003525D34|nr:hypothetical protein CAOG_01223 [Capsaspora owczarzaki ATCC 30864]|eukprot:XP_004349738.2 hypothetical protein CAOG_01223 [Capsaspora owczarzaki ATCC 30864]